MKEMFRGCEKLTTIPELNMENVQEANNMFDGCKELLTIPNLNTSNVLYMTDMFCDCEKLTEIKGLDMSSIPPDAECTADMFENCLSLTDLRINNINALELRIGGASFKGKWGHLLSVESLIYILNELLPDNRNGNTRTLYVGEDNLTKLGNVYVKLVDVTTEMETTDPRIHDKYPMVLCDSNDPDAMDIWGYIGYKNWNIEA
jgi:surface protein